MENAFFQMLSLHNQILNDIDLSRKTERGIITTNGRDVIKTFSERMNKIYKQINSSSNTLSEREKADQAYNKFWLNHKSELSHYYRFLYNLIRFVDNSESNNKTFYIALIRAQLSNQELGLLYYNCLSPQGSAFMKYAEDYSLFNNLIDTDLMIPDHIKFMSKKALGKNP